MARPASLTINVNQTQFQSFVKGFNQLSGQIKNLNSQFAQINASINKTNIAMRALNAGMQGAGNALASISSTAGRITKKFLSWHTIVGAVTGLLGAGGGMMGIDRLADSILQKRRFAMGIGSDYGKTQAAMVSGQGIFGGGTGDILRNIRMGLGGSTEQLKALTVAGIPYGTKEPTTDVMEKMIKFAAHVMQTAPKGAELIYAQQYGLTSIFTPDQLFRMMTKEGQEELKLREKYNKDLAETLKLTPETTKAWRNLSIQLAAAGAQVQTVLAKGLEKLTGPLSSLSTALVNLLDVFLKSDALKAIIARLTKWMDDLAKKLSTLSEKDMNDFMDNLGKTIAKFQPALDGMVQFAKIVALVVKGLLRLLSFLPITDEGKIFSGVTPYHKGNQPPTTPSPTGPSPTPDSTTPTPDSTTPAPAPTGPAPAPTNLVPTQSPTGPDPTVPSENPPPTTSSGRPHFNISQSTPTPFKAGTAIMEGMNPQNWTTNNGIYRGGPGLEGGTGGPGLQGAAGETGFPGTPSGLAPVKPPRSGNFNIFTGRTDSSKPSGPIMPKPPSIPRTGFPGSPSGPGSSGPSREEMSKEPWVMGNIDGWSKVARNMVPVGNQRIQPTSFTGHHPPGANGALDVDNWQMSRTANLVVRDVPGSNIFLSAAGMSV